MRFLVLLLPTIFSLIFLSLLIETVAADQTLLYIESQTCTPSNKCTITNPSYALSVPDNNQANAPTAGGGWAQNAIEWTYTMENAIVSGTFQYANITFYNIRSSANVDDALVLEYQNGNNTWFILHCYESDTDNCGSNPSSAYDTSNTNRTFLAPGITSFDEVNTTQIRMRGYAQDGGPNNWEMYIDAVMINVTYTVVEGDNTPPTWGNATDNATITPFGGRAYRGQVVNISATWIDNALDAAWLATNETGSYRNYTDSNGGIYWSPADISGTYSLVNFSWMNNTGKPRPIGWIIYANDTANNTNGTNDPSGFWQGNFTMWGWSNITWNSPATGSSYNLGDTVQLLVFVNDTNTTGSGPIESYPVSFYWENSSTSTLLGTNYTNASGIAFWDWNTAGLYSGTYFPKGNITQNGTLFYNASEVYQANITVTLFVVYNRNVSMSLSMNSDSPRKYTSLKTTVQSFELTSSSPTTMGAVRFTSQFLSSTQDVAKKANQLRYAINDFTANDVISRLISIPRLISQQIDVSQIVSRFAILSRMISQQIDVSQITARIVQFSKSLSETFSVNQVVSRFVIISKYSVNSFTTNTSNVIGRVYVRLATTTASVTDVVQRVLLNNRIVTNILSVNDALQRVFLSVRSGIQSLAVNSAVSRFITTIKYTSQSFTANAVVSRFITIPRTVADSFSVSSITSRFVIIPREISQSVNVNTMVTRLASLSKSLNQTFNLSQVAARVASLQRLSTNAFGLNTVIQRVVPFVRTALNSFTANTVVSRFVTIPRTMSQAVNMNEVVSRFLAIPRVITQTFNLNNIAVRTAAFPRSITAQIAVSDAVQRIFVSVRSSVQSFAVDQVVNRMMLAVRSSVNGFTANFAVSRFAILPKIVSQQVNVNQIVSRFIIIPRYLSDSFSLSAVAEKTSNFLRIGISSFSTSTSISIKSMFTRVTSLLVTVENIGLRTAGKLNEVVASVYFNVNQIVSRFATIPRAISQTFNLNQITTRIIIFSKSMSQTLNLNSTLTRVASFSRILSSSFTSNAVVSRFVTIPKSVVNSLNLQAITSRFAILPKMVSQQMNVNQVVSRFVTIPRTFSNSIGLQTITSRFVTIPRTINQTFNLSQVASRIAAFPRSITAQIAVSDSIQRVFLSVRSSVQSFAVDQVVNRMMLAVRSTVNGMTANFAVSRFAILPKVVSQQVNVNEIVSKVIIIPRSIGQAVGFTVATTKTAVFTRFVSFYSILNENVSSFSLKLYQRTASMALAITDALQKTAIATRNVIGMFSLDIMNRNMLALSRTFSQTIGLSGIPSKFSIFSRTITDSFSTNATVTRFLIFTKFTGQDFSINQITAKLVLASRSVTESISTTTVSARLLLLTRSFTQAFSITEYSTRIVPFQLYDRVVSLTMGINNAIQRTAKMTRFVTESFNLNTISSRITGFFRAVASYFQITFRTSIPCPPLCIPQPTPAPTPAPTGGGGGGGISPAIVKTPTVAVEFIKWSIFEEVIPGQATVQDILVKNKENGTIKELKIEVEGISKEWIFVTPETIDLGPGEVKSFTISIAVPKDAEPGDYRVIVTLKNSGVDDRTFFILRIRSYVRTDTPIVTRVIDLDYSKNRTEVDLTVSNTYKNISLIQVLEDVPKDMAKTSDEIEFITSPTEILRKDPLIQWDLLNMFAGESRTISYAVKNILEEYSAYIYFLVREMNVITGKIPVGFKLVDFDIPPLSAGRSEVVTFTIRNIDNATHSLQFYIGLPKGWKADPEKIEANISANEVRKFRVSIVVPEGTVKGNYVIQTLFFWDENSFIREIQVTVAKPINMLLVLIIIIGVGTIVYIIMYRTKRRREIRPAIERIRRIAYEVREG